MSLIPSFLLAPESPFAPPSFIYTILHHPVTFLFTFVHYLILYLRGPAYKAPPNAYPIRVVCISDTHCKIPPKSIPKGDLLIHCGDLTNRGTIAEIQQSIDWLKTLQKVWYGSSEGFLHTVVIAGNHDSFLDPRSRSNADQQAVKRGRELNWGKIRYLQHSSVTLSFIGDRKLKIYGAPQIPACGGSEFAYQYARGQDAWSNTIPDDVDVLVTHNPPKWHLDVSENGGLGDEFELAEAWRVKPTLHAFGHVHSGAGMESVWWDDGQKAFEQLRKTAYGDKNPDKPSPSSLFSAVGELLNLKLWTIGITMLNHDLRGLLWTRLWGGVRQGGFMVNAALTYQTTNKLGNPPQVIVL